MDSRQLELPGTGDPKAHRCGRRGPYIAGSETPFRPPYGDGGIEKPDTWRADGTCSYCGSASQAAFLKFVEEGGEVGPTDKSYKVYLHSHMDGAAKMVNAPGRGKFYFQHLDDHGRAEFIRLFNEHKMKVGYPGHFYVTPFFCKREV